ncbi:MAG: SRPBCC family protein [Aeromicrobium sp.]
MEQARVERTLPHPVGEVWAVVSSFGGLRGWIPDLERCSVEGVGVGAVRTVTVAGHTVDERLEVLDPDAHVVTYAVLPPHPFPADDVTGTIRLTDDGADGTLVEWWCEAGHVDDTDLMVRMVRRLYRTSVEGLEAFLAD